MRQGGPCFGLIASLKIKIGLTFVSGIVLSVIFCRPSWGLLKPSICMLRNHISGSRGGLSLAQRRRLNSTALTRGLYTKKKECTEILVFFLSLSFPHSNEVRKSEVRQSKKKKKKPTLILQHRNFSAYNHHEDARVSCLEPMGLGLVQQDQQNRSHLFRARRPWIYKPRSLFSTSSLPVSHCSERKWFPGLQFHLL